MNRMLLLLVFSPLLASASGGDNVDLKANIRQLYALRKTTISAPNDEKRLAADREFLQLMRKTLADPQSYVTAFDTIPQLADLRSGDNHFRIINWNVPLDNKTHQYRCFIQYYDRKAKAVQVIELKRGYSGIEGEPRKVFTDKNWYGALYYDIIPSKTWRSGRKRTYMLLGWDGHDEYSAIKFVDVLVMTQNRITFGSDIFDLEDKGAKRFILEYKSDAQVSLKYDPNKKMIVFNQLVPMQPDLEGMYEFYVPVTEFDALEWKGRKWAYTRDVNARTKGHTKNYNDPPQPQNIK